MRKHYIDNLRNMIILLLFPVHTFMIWNDFGSRFYIWQRESRVLSTLIVMINPWFMPMLFVLAGMSARYALKKRTYREFILNRTRKLLVPFIFGMVFLNPFMTFYARKYFYNYEGNLFDNWKYFFTHITDLSGYDGACTPGHLWFILFLYIISVSSLFIFSLLPCPKDVANFYVSKRFALTGKIQVWGIFLLFIPIWLMYYLGNFGGYSIGKYMALYLIGYYVLGSDTVINKLEKNIKWLSVLCAAGNIALAVLYYRFAYYGDLWINYIGWNTILVLLVISKKFINRRTIFTEYFNRVSYPIYILHQPILVAIAYYTVQPFGTLQCGNMPLCDNVALQAILICLGSFALTVCAYHLIRFIRLKFKLPELF